MFGLKYVSILFVMSIVLSVMGIMSSVVMNFWYGELWCSVNVMGIVMLMLSSVVGIVSFSVMSMVGYIVVLVKNCM